MAARGKSKRKALTIAEQIEGARAYLLQAAERVGALETAEAEGRRDMVMVEVARDESREAAKLMQRVFERTRRAAARPAPTAH